MPESPASPTARRLVLPGWLDTRLVLGVLLVLLSVLVGARVLAGSDRSQLVWATSRSLAPGSVLTADDLVAVRVRLFDSTALYLDASRPAPVGYVAARGLGKGELLPDEALRRPEVDVDFRLVTVLVELGHVSPDLASGQQVDGWVSPARDGAAPQPVVPQPVAPQPEAPTPSSGAGMGAETPTAVGLSGAQVVLSGVTVSAGPPEAGLRTGGSAVPVVLMVKPQDVAPLLSATTLGRIDLVRVPRSAEVSAPVEPVPSPVSAGG